MNPKLHFENSGIQVGEYEMADKNFEYQPIHAKLCGRGLFGSLIMDLKLFWKFFNCSWLIQNGELQNSNNFLSFRNSFFRIFSAFDFLKFTEVEKTNKNRSSQNLTG